MGCKRARGRSHVRKIISSFDYENMSTTILPLPLIQEEQLSDNGERMYTIYGKLPPGGLPWNSVVRITDRPDMTSAVYRGRKASNQNKKKILIITIS